MSFRFPTAPELTDEQRAVLELPLDGRALIAGPPGTGKTVLALARTRQAVEAGRKPTFLVYNNPLRAMIQGEASGLGVDERVHTYHSWVGRMFRTVTGKVAPKIAEYVYDWPAIAHHAGEILEARDRLDIEDVIVDEAQDLPKDFFALLHGIGTNLTVFADENQTLTSVNSSLAELKTALVGPRQMMVTRNFRNTRPVATLAQHFYTGISTGIPSLPERPGAVPRLVRCDDIRTFARAVCRVALIPPQRDDIGVLTRKTDDRDAVFDCIAAELWPVAEDLAATRDPASAKEIRTRAERIRSSVHRYVRGQSPPPLHAEGIFVMTHQSGKGLEFDSTFVWLDGMRKVPDTAAMMSLYVLSTRPRHELYLAWRGLRGRSDSSGVPPWLTSIPDEELQRVRAKP